MATTQNARPDDDAADTRAVAAGTHTARQSAQTAPLQFDDDEAATKAAEADKAAEVADLAAKRQEDPAAERAVGAPLAQPSIAPVTDDDWWVSSAPAEGELIVTSMTAIVTALALAQPDEPTSDEPVSDEPLGDVAQPRVANQRDHGTQLLERDALPSLRRVHSAQGLAAMAARDIGRVRSANQDSVFSLLTSLPREGGDVAMGLFIVADGMGGHEGGEIASRLAVRTVVHQVLAQLVLPALDDGEIEALQSLMITAVQEANSVIWAQAQAQGTDMGTTCTAVLMMGHGLYIAHVGDSRAYLYGPEGLRQLTTDHSTVGRLIALGHLDSSEAREHPLRNQLYRTVGQQSQISVDFVYQPAASGTHLLLCSDGLWGLIDDPLLAKALESHLWPQDACNELIALANLAGGEDNISAVVISLPVVVDDQGRIA